MFFKKCPFCNQTVENFFDAKTKEFSIFCSNCEKKGITIKIVGTDIEDVVNKWNNRSFDNLLLEDPEQTIKDLLAYKNGAEIQNKKYHFEYFDKDDFGWLILDDLTVIRCQDSHPEEILRYYEMGTDIDGFDYEKFCVDNGIVRIGVLKRCFFISIPTNVIHNQITKIIEILAKEAKPEIIKYIVDVDSKTCQNKREVIEFQTLNNLILYLDKVA